jgi:diguanylate cyclase (GGDEF)-like protein
MAKPKTLLFSFLSLKDKLKVSFYLTVVLPLLVCVYLVSDYILPIIGVSAYVTALVFLNIFIAMAGFALIQEAFCQMVTENEKLTRRMEKLEINDAVTGLFNESFIRNRLEEEIKRAIMHQRPCAFILLRIENFDLYREKFGSTQSETALRKCAFLIKETVTEIDPIGRIQENLFAIILAEKNKRQAQHTASEIKQKLESAFSYEEDSHKRLMIKTGVSENPLDGILADELVEKAREALKAT